MLDIPSYILGKKSGGSKGTTVVANPELVGTEDDLTGLQVGDTKYKVSTVEANPTLAGTEAELTGLQVGNTKYKIDNLEYYSTDEQVVGTWINGKPVYQKVIENTVTLNNYAVVGTINNVKDTISVNWFVAPSDSTTYGRTGYLNSNYYTGIQAEVDSSNVLTITIWGKEGQTSTSTNVRVIVRYTKTTD